MWKYITLLFTGHLHEWGVWKEAHRTLGVVSDIIIQERYCKTCGKGQQRTF